MMTGVTIHDGGLLTTIISTILDYFENGLTHPESDNNDLKIEIGRYHRNLKYSPSHHLQEIRPH